MVLWLTLAFLNMGQVHRGTHSMHSGWSISLSYSHRRHVSIEIITGQ